MKFTSFTLAFAAAAIGAADARSLKGGSTTPGSQISIACPGGQNVICASGTYGCMNNSPTLCPATTNSTVDPPSTDTAAADLHDDIMKFVEAQTAEIQEWGKQHAAELAPLIQQGMQMFSSLQAEIAKEKGSNESVEDKATNIHEMLEKMAKSYMLDPTHKEQLMKLKTEVKEFLSKHKTEFQTFLSTHTEEILMFLKQKIQEVKSGKVAPAPCDITEPSCATKLGYSPTVEEYISKHKEDTKAGMKQLMALQQKFMDAHKGQLLNLLNGLIKFIETVDKSALKLKGNNSTAYASPAHANAPPAYAPPVDTTPPAATSRLLGDAGVMIPPGTYNGLGKKDMACVFSYCAIKVRVNATAILHQDTPNVADLIVDATGASKVRLNCPGEPFSTDAATNKITLTNYDAKDGCIQKALPIGVTLKSLTYDPAKKSIDIKVGPIDLLVKATCSDCSSSSSAYTATDKTADTAATKTKYRSLRSYDVKRWFLRMNQ